MQEQIYEILYNLLKTEAVNDVIYRQIPIGKPVKTPQLSHKHRSFIYYLVYNRQPSIRPKLDTHYLCRYKVKDIGSKSTLYSNLKELQELGVIYKYPNRSLIVIHPCYVPTHNQYIHEFNEQLLSYWTTNKKELMTGLLPAS